jgi:hypothetical protein
MMMLDDPITVCNEITTQRGLAAEKRIVLRRSDSYSPGPGVPTRRALWADLSDESPTEGQRGFEISKAVYAKLQKMGVPVDPAD